MIICIYIYIYVCVYVYTGNIMVYNKTYNDQWLVDAYGHSFHDGSVIPIPQSCYRFSDVLHSDFQIFPRCFQVFFGFMVCGFRIKILGC